MPRIFHLTGRHMAGGINLAKGDRNTNPTENIESQFMEYDPEGDTTTSLGWDLPAGWAIAESAKGVDGLHNSKNYPDLVFKAVNGKIKQANSETGTFYNVDTGLALTAGNPVLFREYRGNIYFANGVEDIGRIPVAQFASAVSAGGGTWALNTAEGYKFTNGSDKVYSEGDEADYTAVATDSLTTVTNGLAHAAGAYVTQYNTLSAPSGGSLKGKTMAFWRDTFWYAGQPTEPNLLRYSKTISSVGTVANVNDFSDGNNYLIGEGGIITALQPSNERLYVFMKDRVHYIGIEVNSSAAYVFSPDRQFTANYGCPNAFCVAEMEDVVVFFTGKRLIRIGYQPNLSQLLPDESFDDEIYSILATADADQSNARLHYNAATKKLYLTFIVNGQRKTIVYNNRAKKYAYPWDHDANCYVNYKNATFFGDPDDDNVFKFGADLDGYGAEIPHVYKTGRMDGGSRETKRFIRGMVEGRIAVGTTINFIVYINGKQVGGTRSITSAHADTSGSSSSIGTIVVGGEVPGGNVSGVSFYNFRYPFLVNMMGEDVQLKFSSFGQGSFWSLSKYQIDGVVYDQIPYTKY